jgi:hypothetical protein
MNVSIDMTKYLKHYERKNAVFIRIYKNVRKGMHIYVCVCKTCLYIIDIYIFVLLEILLIKDHIIKSLFFAFLYY